MNPKDATTPLVEMSPVTPPLPPEATGPNTYEDAILIIDNLKDEKNADNLHAGLNKLHGFFKRRIGKKAASDEKDGGAAVKRAMAGRAKFTKYQPAEIKNEPASTNLW